MQALLDHAGPTSAEYHQLALRFSPERLQDAWVMLDQKRFPRRFFSQRTSNMWQDKELNLGVDPPMLVALAMGVEVGRIKQPTLNLDGKSIMLRKPFHSSTHSTSSSNARRLDFAACLRAFAFFFYHLIQTSLTSCSARSLVQPSDGRRSSACWPERSREGNWPGLGRNPEVKLLKLASKFGYAKA